MRSINKVILIGNLTRDPEMRTTQSNQCITTFGMATNREWVTREGAKQQSSEFHDIVCWGRLAELAKKFLNKGKLVHIEGHLKTRSWDDASGIKKFRTEIVAEDLIMLDKRPNEGTGNRVQGTENFPTKSSYDFQDDEKLQPSITIEDPAAIH